MRKAQEVMDRVVRLRREVRGNLHIDPSASVPRDAILGASVTIGAHSGINRGFTAKGRGPISIGRFCAIGQNVTLISGEHPTGRLATQFGLYRKLGWDHTEIRTDGLRIGSDVWIGDGAIVLSEVKIGDGAVIAAGAVVTHDVPEFAIVAGTPARVLRFRFPEDQCRWVAELRWWDRELQDLTGLQQLFEADIAASSIEELSRLAGTEE